MTPLREMPVAVIDFEATDFPGPDAHVCEVAVVHTILGEPESSRVAFSSLVRPPVTIPDRVAAIHGIRNADVVDAPTWAEIEAEVVAACMSRAAVVAYNAPADYQFFRTEQGRTGGKTPAWPWLDLLVVRKAVKTRGRPGRLAEIAAEQGIVLDAHGAAGDAMATALVMTALLRGAFEAHAVTLNGRRPATLEGLLEWQRGAALAQEREFADYRRRQGDAVAPRCDWHQLEGVEAPAWPAAERTMYCRRCGGQTRMKIEKDGTVGLYEARTAEVHVCEGGGTR